MRKVRWLFPVLAAAIGAFVVSYAAQTTVQETPVELTTRYDGSPLNGVPAEGLTLVLRRRLGERAYVMGRAAAYARDDDNGPTERVTPGHATFDLGAGLRLGPSSQLRFLVRNLADRECPATPDARSVAAPGRAALLTLNVGF